MDDFFIDKLNILQTHHDVPRVGKRMMFTYDMATGEKEYEGNDSLQLEGSYSTKLTIKSDGNRVSVYGNPSRFNRLDNLFGFTTFEQCLSVYNRVLAEFDLPPFTRCTEVHYNQCKETQRHMLVTDGAIINHVDWTRNMCVGEGNVFAFLRALSSFKIRKGRNNDPHLFPNGKTLEWGGRAASDTGNGSTSRYDKLYEKEHDLARSIRKNKELTIEEIRYLSDLMDYCRINGLVRQEHSFKKAFLKKHKLNLYGMTKESSFAPYLRDIDLLLERIEMSTQDYVCIAEQLIQAGVCKSTQSANATQAVAHKWMHGSHIDRNSQYYVHRNRLLEIGLDISQQFNVSTLAPTIRKSRVIEWKPATAPSFYRHVNHLAQVA